MMAASGLKRRPSGADLHRQADVDPDAVGDAVAIIVDIPGAVDRVIVRVAACEIGMVDGHAGRDREVRTNRT